MAQDFYEFLGIRRDATSEQINQAFRERAMQLHPDKNKDNPEAAPQFKLLTQAYQILGNPARRAKYDESLPPLPSLPGAVAQRTASMDVLWTQVGEVFFNQERYSKALDAIRLSVPITLEEDLLVLGLDPVNSGLIAYTSSQDTTNKIRRILSDLRGKPTDFRIINGTSPADWQVIKDGEDKYKQRRQGGVMRQSPMDAPVISSTMPAPSSGATSAASPTPTAPPRTGVSVETAAGWDEMLDRMMKQWSDTESRALPQVRARFALDQVGAIARTEEATRRSGIPEDGIQRGIGRALERIASLTNIDSGILGIEYLRFRVRMLGGM